MILIQEIKFQYVKSNIEKEIRFLRHKKRNGDERNSGENSFYNIERNSGIYNEVGLQDRKKDYII